MLGPINPDPQWMEEMKSVYAKARNPLAAEGFATLTADRARLAGTIKHAILEITNDSGLGKTTMRDRIKVKNDLIRESAVA